MTIKEGIYDIREALHSYNVDSEVSNRHIYFLMVSARRKVIREHINRKPGEWRDQMTQTIVYDLEKVTQSYTDVLLGEMVRTTNPVPNAIGWDVFKNYEIRPIDRISREIEVIDKTRAVEVGYANKGFIYAFKDDDNYFYFLSKDTPVLIEKVVITSILEDPKDAEEITGEEVEDFYLPTNMWAQVKSIVLSQFRQAPNLDTVNEGLDTQQA